MLIEGISSLTKFEKKLVEEVLSVGVSMDIHRDQLNVDHHYQRLDISHKTVRQIKNNYNPVGFGMIIVARRPDGCFYIIDGQHRWLAAKEMPKMTMLPCRVHDIASVKLEALAFELLNEKRTTVTPSSRFRASIVAGDPRSIDLSRTLNSAGINILAKNEKTNNTGKPATFTITRLRNLHTKNPALTRKIIFQLAAISKPTDKIAEEVIGGLFYIADKTEGESLSPFWTNEFRKLGVNELKRIAAGNVDETASSPSKWALNIANRVNKGRRTKKLSFSIRVGEND